MAELSTCSKDPMAIYYLALYRKRLPTPALNYSLLNIIDNSSALSLSVSYSSVRIILSQGQLAVWEGKGVENLRMRSCWCVRENTSRQKMSTERKKNGKIELRLHLLCRSSRPEIEMETRLRNDCQVSNGGRVRLQNQPQIVLFFN